MKKVKLCNRCGARLYETFENSYFCVNCGVLPMNNDDEIESDEETKYYG